MFEDYLKPYASNPEEVSANASFNIGNNKAQLSDQITPDSAIQNFLGGGVSSKEIDWPTPWQGADEWFLLSDRLLPNDSASFAPIDSNFISQPETLSVDSLTGKSLSPNLEQAFTSAYNHLNTLVSNLDFSTKMNLAFGQNWDTEEAKKLLQELAQGDAMPAIVILPSYEINGANGAFASVTNTIYLSSEFIAQNAVNPEAITSVVIEEIGHYIDSRINKEDAAGDEGEIFAAVVQGKTLDEPELLALKAEDDTATITLDGKESQIEQSTPSNFGINLYSGSYSRAGNKFVSSNRTGGTYLWCTDFAFGRALEKGLIQNYSGTGGRISGHAGVWDDQAGSWGRQAQANSFVVWDPWQGGAGSVGHVGFVERVNSDGSFTISEANFGSAVMSFNSRTISPGSSAFNTAKFVYLAGTAQPTPTLPPPSGLFAFRGTVDASLNVRSGPGTNSSIVNFLSAGSSRTFDAMARATSHWDAREGRYDDRWFRLQGTSQWVSAAFITGNPLFNGSVDAPLNVRSGPGTSFSIVGSLSSGSSRTFDATTLGTTHWDAREGRYENRWFRLQGTNQWVSAAFITGNPTY